MTNYDMKPIVDLMDESINKLNKIKVMETKHTKEEWVIEKFHNGYHIWSIGKKICSVWSNLFTNAENEANAKLIAAAPELLKSLNDLLPMARDGYKLSCKNGIGEDFLEDDRKLLENARQAIKKATS